MPATQLDAEKKRLATACAVRQIADGKSMKLPMLLVSAFHILRVTPDGQTCQTHESQVATGKDEADSDKTEVGMLSHSGLLTQ